MKHTDDLEKKIKGAFMKIKNKTATPAESNVGNLFKQLKPLDEALHEKLMTEYKTVFSNWKKEQ